MRTATAFLTLAALFASSVASAAVTETCPAGGRFATNQADGAFCLYEPITLPAASGVESYCQYLQDGYIGFSWTESAATKSYECPAGSRNASNTTGEGYCVWELGSAVRSSATPYCGYLAEGYIGYSWSICPSGGTYSTSGTTGYCKYENITMPKGVGAYCNYLTDGYFGFAFPEGENAGYKCPAGFIADTNEAGTGFCLVEDLTDPAVLAPYCSDLTRGEIGFSWPLKGM